MYYLLNLAFIMFMIISIGLVCSHEVSSQIVLIFLLVAAVCELLASAYATSKYNTLEDRIMKLENKKEK